MCEFWDFPDSDIRNTPELRAKIAETITELAPDVVVTIYSGPEWEPGAPNQRDHIEFANAVADAYDSLSDPPQWLFENGPEVTHAELIDDRCFERAVASLAAHDVYLSVLDPDTPVIEQAHKQVDMATSPRPEFDGHRRSSSSSSGSPRTARSAVDLALVALGHRAEPIAKASRNRGAVRSRSSPRRPTPDR